MSSQLDWLEGVFVDSFACDRPEVIHNVVLSRILLQQKGLSLEDLFLVQLAGQVIEHYVHLDLDAPLHDRKQVDDQSDPEVPLLFAKLVRERVAGVDL